MKLTKISVLITIITVKIYSTQAEEVCFGDDNPISLYDDDSLVNIFIDCVLELHLVGTVIGPNKVLTAARPFVNVTKDAVMVSVQKSDTCPQKSPKEGGFKVETILFYHLFVENKECHDIAVLILDRDITEDGATIATVNFNAFKLQGIAETFKCLTYDNGVEGFQKEKVTILKLKTDPCANVTTTIGNTCSPIGSPLIYKGGFIGFQTACRPFKEPLAVYLFLPYYKSFLTPIIYDGSIDDFAISFNDLPNKCPIFHEPHSIPDLGKVKYSRARLREVLENEEVKDYEEISAIFQACSNRFDSKSIKKLVTKIQAAHVCDKVKHGLLQVIRKYLTIDYKDHAISLNLPNIIANDDYRCEDPLPGTSSSTSPEPVARVTQPTFKRTFFDASETEFDPSLNPQEFLNFQSQLRPISDHEKKLINNIKNFTNKKHESNTLSDKIKERITKTKLGVVVGLLDLGVAMNEKTKEPNSSGKLANVKAGSVWVKAVPKSDNK